MRRIQVVEVFSGYAIEGPLGGAERFAVELSRALDPERFQVIACGLWDYDRPYEQHWIDYLRDAGVEAFVADDWDPNAPYLSFWRALRRLPSLLSPFQPDILHSHFQFEDFAVLGLKRLLGASLLVRTVHNEREWPKRPWRRWLYSNWLFPAVFNAEIGVSRAVVENLNRRPGARLLGERALLIYNALNLERFTQVHTERCVKMRSLGLPTDAIVLGSIGRLVYQKGLDILLHAFKEAICIFPQMNLLLIGTGPLLQDLQCLVTDLDLKGKVHFLGPRSDVEELLTVMDVLVSSSRWEGLPTVLLEGMAAGVPIVATDVSGSREIVESGHTGLLVPPDNPEVLAQAIIEVLRNRREADICAVRARERIYQDFSIKAVARQYAKLYTRLMKL